MTAVVIIANGLLPLLYLALLVDYGAALTLRLRPPRAHGIWLIGVIVVHGAYLVLRMGHGGHGVLASAALIPSLLGLSMAVVYATVEVATGDRRTGMFVLLLVFLLQYVSSMFFPMPGAATPMTGAMGRSLWWGHIHIVPAMLAYTALAFAAVYGLLHLVVRRGLKRHHFGVLFDRLPPLDTLGKMAWYALLVGFIFMTITMASSLLLFGGEGGARAAGPGAPKVMAKIIVGSAAWLIYAAAVLGRFLGKWNFARVSWVAIAGFTVVVGLMIASGALS